MPYTKINLKEKLIATMAILALAIIVIKTDLHGKDDEKSGQNKLINFNIERVESIQDTVPNQERREEMTIIRKDGKEDVEMKMEDGKITTLKINGKEVDPEDFDKHKDILDEMRFKRMSEDDFSFGSPENGNLHRFEFNFGDDEGQNFSFDFPDMQNFKFKLDSLSTMNFPGLDSTFAFGFMGDTHSAEISEMMEKLKNQMGEMNHLKGFYFPGSQDKFQWFGNKDQDDDFDLNKDENLEDMLGSQLNADGFLIPGQENLIELSSKSLKINGEKQPSNIFNKYKRIFERETGLELSKNTKLEFNIIGKEAKRKYRAF